METIAERVARGAALLDERRRGWAGEIDCGWLDIGRDCCCILGQLNGDFVDGLLALSEECDMPGIWDNPADYGFARDGRPTDLSDPEEFSALTAAWLAAIAARLAPEPAWEPELQEAEPCLTT